MALCLLIGAVGLAAWGLHGRLATKHRAPPPPPLRAQTPPAATAKKSPAAPVQPPQPPPPPIGASTVFPRPVEGWFEAQIALDRCGLSCGSIDGTGGAQTLAALHAFQDNEGLPHARWLDPATNALLLLDSPPLTTYTVTAGDLARLQPLSPTWLGKSQQSALEFETVLELVAERCHASPRLLQRLNPSVDWSGVATGTELVIPAVARPRLRVRASTLRIRLGDRTLDALDEAGRILARFPVSIARDVEKRPVGERRVTVAIAHPDYTFNPGVFPESAEARTLDRKLIVPPGPNNPVGVAWIGLDLPGYGIHGTPHPEQVGRTESHGCFRLANWNAAALLDLVWPGLPVVIEP